MHFAGKIPLITYFLLIFLTKHLVDSLLSNGKNYKKLFPAEVKPRNHLFVSIKHYEPFLYRNENGKFYNGVEHKLFEMIAEKKNVDVVYRDQLSFFDQHIFR